MTVVSVVEMRLLLLLRQLKWMCQIGRVVAVVAVGEVAAVVTFMAVVSVITVVGLMAVVALLPVLGMVEEAAVDFVAAVAVI